MDGIKDQVLTGKSIRLLRNNQYTFEVDTELTKPKVKDWIERFFRVKVKGMNSYRLPNKKKKKKSLESFDSRKRMIITLQENYSIPFFLDD
uniref:ribosomal protein L23 n=1 Tax=Lygodium circinatum TaxID=84615 RepID=UPI002A80FAC5|nr:ribosomal protein L23 [Lygodium circinatum]UYR96135.1 ribosomal protein L23 [Lygodium circinatum]